MSLLHFLYNPHAVRDKRGKVINDIPRRLASRRTKKLLKDGLRGQEQKDYTTGGRKYRVGLKGNVDMKGESK